MSPSRSLHPAFLLVLAAITIPIPATGQETARASHRLPTRDLTATGTFPEPFSRIAGLRALPDGRLLIADRLEQRLSVLDFTAGTAAPIGRDGAGPGEYRVPAGLFAMPDGGTLLADIGNMRLSRITAAGKIETTFPMMSQSDDTPMFINPQGTDASGRVFFTSSVSFSGPTGGVRPTDSTAILRMELATGQFDTVAMIERPTVSGRNRPTTRRIQGGGTIQFAGGALPGPFAARAHWAVATDGALAIAHPTPYRVDWVRDGQVTRGPEIPYEAVPITRADQEAWRDRQARQTLSVTSAGGGSGGGTLRLDPPSLDEVVFPRFMPPFVNVVVTPEGQAWVQLSQPTSRRQPVFDVFDRGGTRIEQVRLPADRQLVGFGPGVVYAVWTDADDLQWLERYRH